MVSTVLLSPSSSPRNKEEETKRGERGRGGRCKESEEVERECPFNCGFKRWDNAMIVVGGGSRRGMEE